MKQIYAKKSNSFLIGAILTLVVFIILIIILVKYLSGDYDDDSQKISYILLISFLAIITLPSMIFLTIGYFTSPKVLAENENGNLKIRFPLKKQVIIDFIDIEESNYYSLGKIIGLDILPFGKLIIQTSTKKYLLRNVADVRKSLALIRAEINKRRKMMNIKDEFEGLDPKTKKRLKKEKAAKLKLEARQAKQELKAFKKEKAKEEKETLKNTSQEDIQIDQTPSNENIQNDEKVIIQENIKASPEDINASPEDINASPKDINASPEDINASPEDINASPEEPVATQENQEKKESVKKAKTKNKKQKND